MKESVAIAKEAVAKKDFSPTKSDNSIHLLQHEPKRQLGSLRSVIDNVKHDGGTPSIESIATHLSSMHTAQRAPVLLALQRTHGNWYVQRVVAGIQAKLKVGQPGDIYEQEADRVADAVMRVPEPEVQRLPEEGEELIQTKPLTEQITPLVQRQVEDEEEEEEPIQTKLLSPEHPILQRQEEEEEEIIQPKEASSQTPEVTPDLESRIKSLKGGGQALPEKVRAYFEPRFGHDLSNVHVHSDRGANQLAQSINAKAFTLGRHVVFGTAQYAPDTNRGRRLLAHELTHVIQQAHLPCVEEKSKEGGFQIKPLSGQITIPVQRQEEETEEEEVPEKIPKTVPKKAATIECHTITQDPGLKSGIVHDDLKKFKKVIMKSREKDESHWTLFFTMHGWENYLAYKDTCTPGKDCFTLDNLKSIFSGKDWENWRKKYGPWKVILTSCFLTDEMAKGVEALLKRDEAPSTSVGKSTSCETSIDTIDLEVEINGKPVVISTPKQYQNLSIENKRAFLVSLNKIKKIGYFAVDTTKMNEEELLHYFFNEPPKGAWLKCKITYVVDGEKKWEIPLYKYTPGSIYYARCKPLKYKERKERVPSHLLEGL